MNPAQRAGRDRLEAAGVRWGYALNAHPTETLDQLIAAVSGPAAQVRRHLGLDGPLGVELRLGARGIAELADATARDRLARALDQAGLDAFSANAFPLAPFTAGVVKASVYRPDWTEPERLALTMELARALVALSPADPLTVSTLAGAYHPARGPEADEAIAQGLRSGALEMARLSEACGRRVVLCVEPEPYTTLETTGDAIAAFARWLDHPESDRLAQHLALNLDVCHQSVVFEDPVAALEQLDAAGVPLAKLHLSAALDLPGVDAGAVGRLARYDEPRYLHQSFARRDGALRRWPDLGDYLADWHPGDWVRVHFHVPLHEPPTAPLRSTADDAARVVRARLDRGPRHWVVETYTWDVLAERALVVEGELEVAVGVARELGWLLEQAAS